MLFLQHKYIRGSILEGGSTAFEDAQEYPPTEHPPKHTSKHNLVFFFLRVVFFFLEFSMADVYGGLAVFFYFFIFFNFCILNS